MRTRCCGSMHLSYKKQITFYSCVFDDKLINFKNKL